ncbi:MAG: hypothetical protein BMS9Abin03_243 [Thermodesulfobacteriota bacterium]|nr:MAG: hypothetical protein BMS9Abin03_243 [Thermodesulfobacteriota bacterium]
MGHINRTANHKGDVGKIKSPVNLSTALAVAEENHTGKLREKRKSDGSRYGQRKK